MALELNTDDAEQFDYSEAVNKFRDFLTHSDSQDVYRDRIEQMVETGVYRLLVDMGDLRQYDTELTNNLIRNPVGLIRAFEEALREVTLGEHPDKELRESQVEFHVGLTGSFGSQHVSPRELTSNFLGQLVCLEGIVTKMSVVKPKIVTAVHYCPTTNKHHIRSFRDWTNLDGLPTSAAIPKVDSEGNALEMDYGHCKYKNTQTLTIQEMPERSPLGQLPRSVDVILEHDLVDSAKPGDRVIIVGLYRARPRGPTFAIFDSKIIANSVQTIGKEVHGIVMTHEDLQNIRTQSKSDNIFLALSRSLAPSIYGHEYIKQALLLLLLGGMERNLPNGTHLRGDINILMVGDPSTAKSQLLRFILGIAPLAVSTTGRGSTGVGLTAAVTTDPETRERRLEAGAMVLADRGVVCIDEFDKMGDADRVAIHEVMEQQTVTIAKGGIHASLNARCSVVAAANPVYGQYDKDSPPQRNVNLPDSLLSRFDLLFIVLDNLNPDHDRRISEHILRLHRYQRPGQEGVPFSISSGTGFSSLALDEEEDREDMTSPVFQKFNPLLHGGFASTNGEKSELYHPEFIRKYIHYAKSRIMPVLSEEACEFIDQEYAALRQEQEVKTLPVTARQLESFIRLATAHAKARLSGIVEIEDVEQALKIIRFALYHDTQGSNSATNMDGQNHEGGEVQADSSGDESDSDDVRGSASPRNHRRRREREEESSSSEDDELMRKPKPAKRKNRSTDKTKRKKHRLSTLDLSSSDDDSDLENLSSLSNKPLSQDKATTKQKRHSEEEEDDDDESEEDITVDRDSSRFRLIQTLLNRLFNERRTEELDIGVVRGAVKDEVAKSKGKEKKFSTKEVDAILEALEFDNRILYRDGKITRI